MKEVPILNYAGLDETRLGLLSEIVAGHRSLDQIFVWGRAQSPPVHPADVVKQDEFTHDVLVPMPDGTWLIYGTTCAVQTVSVWDRRPSPMEILEKRLAAGWTPTPSQLKEGDVVEGFAACVYSAVRSKL